MKNIKKILAIALSVMLLISVMPFAAFAATGVANGAELKAAIAAAQDGDVIEFTADVTEYPATSGALVIPVDGKDITIDLKGHTQYFRVSGETAVSYPTDLFVLMNGAKLTVTDSQGGGAIYATYGANSSAYIFNVLDSSELVINGGQFVMDKANRGGVIVYQNSADASTTINDGDFVTVPDPTATRSYRNYIVNDTRGDVEINGGTFTTGQDFDYVISEGNTTDTSLTINAGEFNGTMSLDISKATTEINGGTYLTRSGDANTAVSAYLPADQIIDSTTGEIKDVDASTVARTNSGEFETLAAALASVGAGETATITLLADCTLASTTEIADNQKITINLNGNDITCPARVFNIRHGQLTISGTGNLNATFTGANAAVAVYGAATDNGSNYSTFTLNSTVTLNALNGYGAMIGANSGAAYGAKLQLNGTINSKYGVYINGNVAEPEVKTNAAAINITGTVTASNEDSVVYAAGYAKWNIYSNANLTGGSGVYIKSGTMNIYGNATITATGEKTAYSFNANGCDPTGDAVIIDSCGYPGNVPTVTIKAGTITSANGEAVASYAKQDDARYPTAEFPRVDNVVPSNSTAVFSSDVTDLAAEGYETVYDAEAGGYVVAQDNHTVAKIGDVKYDTLEAAWNAAVDGDTITLVQDCSGNGLKAPQDKFNDAGLTVDFAGYTYTVDGDLVGSTGTQTQAFQLLKGNTITFENGTIYSEKAKMLIQNYADLTLENMVLDLDNPEYTSAYTLSTNNGSTTISGTTINANPAGGVAFDVCTGWGGYASNTVIVNDDSVINGDVEISDYGQAGAQATLNLVDGELNGDIVAETGAEEVVVNKDNDFAAAAPEGFMWVNGGEGVDSLAIAAASIDNVKYATLEEAFAAAQDGDTITLERDSSGNGIKVPQNKFNNEGLTVDFAGYTYTVNGTTVGSTGTETQGFQLLKDNNITFQNGTIYGSSVDTPSLIFLIQNYSNLTLDNMELVLIGRYYNQYTLSNNNGDIVIDDSTINAPDYSWAGLEPSDAGSFAFDVCRYASYPSVSVTVTGDSVINGNVEVSATGGDAKDGLELNLVSGTLNGDIVIDDTAATLIENEDANTTIHKEAAFSQEAPEGYEWNEDGDLVEKAEPDNGQSLTLDDGVTFNTYLDADAYGVDENEAVVKITKNANADINQQVEYVTTTIPLSEATKFIDQTSEYNGTYKFAFAMAPAQYAEDFTVALYADADAAAPLFTKTTNVKTMCEEVIATSNDIGYVNLCKALCDYCVAAQVYFEYGSAAASYYDDAVTSLAASNMNTPAADISEFAVAGFNFTVVSELNANVFSGSAVDVIDVQAPADSISAQAATKLERSCVNISGIPAAYLDNLVTVQTSGGTFSIAATNIAKYIASTTANSNYANLARALYLYSVQASSFFNA